MDQATAIERALALDSEVGERLRFVYELDRLKGVLRQSHVLDGERQENTAEHSWHVAMTAWAMVPLADEEIDLVRAMKILLVHDIVEIDAGDAFIYDDAAREAAEVAEREAADRIFGLLPEPDRGEMRGLWDEYEARDTPEGRFAYACDRLQPMLLNLAGGGGSWQRHGVALEQVKAVNGRMADGMSRVWAVAEPLLEETYAELVADGAES